MLGSETGHVDLLVHQCMQSVWVLLLIDILGTNSANGHLRLGVVCLLVQLVKRHRLHTLGLLPALPHYAPIFWAVFYPPSGPLYVFVEYNDEWVSPSSVYVDRSSVLENSVSTTSSR